MRAIAALLYITASTAAYSCDATVYIHEIWGDQQTATSTDEGWTINFKDGSKVAYYSASVGTGIPYRALLPIDASDDEAPTFPYRMIGDLLVVGMEVYEPYCP